MLKNITKNSDENTGNPINLIIYWIKGKCELYFLLCHTNKRNMETLSM